MNIWNAFMTVLRGLWNLIIAAWAILGGVTNWSEAQIRRFIIAELVIIGTMAGLFILGVTIDSKVMIVFAGMTSSVAVLIAWKAGDLAIKLVNGVADGLPFIGKHTGPVVKSVMDEIIKLVRPLLAVSMFLSFMASLAVARGTEYITLTSLMLWGPVVLTIEIFAIYINSTKKIAGWVMVGLMIYFVAGSYLWPIQVQSTIDWVERHTVRSAIVATEDTKDYEMVSIANNTPLYKHGWGGFKKEKTTTATETIAKVVSRKKDKESGEPMYEVILPAAPNVYVGGEKLFVPARLARPVKIETPQTAQSRQAVETVVFEKTYDGRGFGDENIIKTIEGGKDAVSGDTVYIEGSHFWIAVNGHWEEAKGWFNIDQLTLADGKHLKIGAEKGVQMKVTVKRWV